MVGFVFLHPPYNKVRCFMAKKTIGYMLFSIFFLVKVVIADCDTAKTLYNQALSHNNIARKIELLKQADDNCRNFNTLYELAKAYEADNQLEKAELSLRDAQAMSTSDKKLAKAAARQGHVLERMNKTEEARICYQKSVDRHPFPQVRERLKNLDYQRMQQGLSAKEIKTFYLTLSKAHNVEPSLDLHINFSYDEATLSKAGKAQADELGKALEDPAFQGRSFTIIGHTDKHASHKYNMRLSRKRASQVKEYLITNFSIDSNRLKAIGRGESELLYHGDAEQDDALNRRVEIKAEY